MREEKPSRVQLSRSCPGENWIWKNPARLFAVRFDKPFVVATVNVRIEFDPTVGRLETFDIVLYLTTIGAAQNDYPQHLATVYKRNVVQDCSFRSERNHSHLVVVKPIINPNQQRPPNRV